MYEYNTSIKKLFGSKNMIYFDIVFIHIVFVLILDCTKIILYAFLYYLIYNHHKIYKD